MQTHLPSKPDQILLPIVKNQQSFWNMDYQNVFLDGNNHCNQYPMHWCLTLQFAPLLKFGTLTRIRVWNSTFARLCKWLTASETQGRQGFDSPTLHQINKYELYNDYTLMGKPDITVAINDTTYRY